MLLRSLLKECWVEEKSVVEESMSNRESGIIEKSGSKAHLRVFFENHKMYTVIGITFEPETMSTVSFSWQEEKKS